MAIITPAAPHSHPTLRSLLSIADRARARLEQELTASGVTFQQYNVLRILADAGPAGVPTLEVAERLMERAPGITRLMDRLERLGFVSRTRGEDRRRVMCAITPIGTELVGAVQPAVAEIEESVVRCLNPNVLGALNHFLNRIRGAMKE